MRASGVLFFFWLLLILAGIPQLRSEVVIHKAMKVEDENVQYDFVSYMIYYPLICIMFVLNCFADLPPKDSPYKFDKVNITFINLRDVRDDFSVLIFTLPWNCLIEKKTPC